MPDPVPMILLGQLASDVAYQSQGLGTDLLMDACERALLVAGTIGAPGIIV